MMMIKIVLLNKIFTYFIGIARKSIAKERIRRFLVPKRKRWKDRGKRCQHKKATFEKAQRTNG